MSFFGRTQEPANTFRFVTINPSLLAGVYNAQTALATASTLQSLPQPSSSGPAVTAPWQLDETPQTLSRGINSVRQKTQFIDLTDATVEAAGDDRDAEATFALFNALTDLRTLAQYASEDRTLESELDRLSETFELGLGQVQSFVAEQTLDKLDLVFESRRTSVTSTATVGRDSNSYSGSVIQSGARTDPLSGVNGTEVFSISLTKAGRTDVVDVDLSTITGDITIDAVADLINARISEIKLVDEFGNPELDEEGNPILDDDGQPVDRYLTRFEVRSDENFDFFLGVDGISTEELSLSANGDPSVYVASTFNSVVTETPDFGRVNQFTDTGAGFVAAKRTDISAGSEALTELAEDVASSNGQNTTEDPVDPVQLSTRTDAVAVDSQGFTYLLSTSSGDVGTQLGTGQDDVFLTKLDSEGQTVFQRLLGTEGSSQGFALTVDANDNVIIAGQTTGRVDAVDVLDGSDSFVVKYDAAGTEVFRSQLDSIVTDAALSVTTNAAGDIFIGGYAAGAVNAETTASGDLDALVLRLDGQTGAIADVALFGTAGADRVTALTVGQDGNLLAAVEEDGRGAVVKLDAAALSNELARTDLGALAGGNLTGIAVTSGTGPSRVVVSGTTGNQGINGGSLLNTKGAGLDAFVTTFEDTGSSLTAQQTRFVGTDAADSGNGLAVDGDTIYLTGRTRDALDGQTRQGPRDGFIARIDAQSGSLDSVTQFGAFGGQSDSVGIAVSNAGESVLSRLGLRSGTINDRQDRTLGTQTSITDGNFFFVSVDGGTARRIDVDADDTFRSVAARVNALSFRAIKAEVSNNSLKIEALNDSRIDILAGPEGSDALVRLGIEPQSILPSDRLFDLNDTRPPEEQLGGTFSLNLDASFNLRDKTTAKYVVTQIDNAISTVQRAFRSLTFDPFAFALQEQSRLQTGTVPTRLNNQIANFQSALLRLQAGSQASTSFTI